MRHPEGALAGVSIHLAPKKSVELSVFGAHAWTCSYMSMPSSSSLPPRLPCAQPAGPVRPPAPREARAASS